MKDTMIKCPRRGGLVDVQAGKMNPTLARKLEKIKHYATRYEIIAKGPSGKILVMYGSKSMRQILDGLMSNDYERLYALAKITGTKPESWKVDKFIRSTSITCGNWAIVPSGRTQREAYIEGELPSIYDDK